MRARGLVITLVAGCGGAPAIEPVTVPVPVPVRPRAGYTIQAGELGDPDVLAKIPHHARLHRHFHASLAETGAPFGTNAGELAYRETVPVLGETRTRLRVVSDEDDARIALWIDRADAAPVVVAPAQLADADGHALGVWLDPGVDLELVRARGPGDTVAMAGAWSEAIAHVDGLDVHTAHLRAEAVGEIWIGADPRARFKTSDPAHLPGHTQVRAAPRPDGRVLVETLEDLGIALIASRGDWREIELHHRGVRIRGFVPARALDPEGLGRFGTFGHGSGRGYGISDTDEFEIAAGACLYDREGGAVIGVNTKTRQRYGHRGAHDEWPAVYVGTAWELVLVRAHAIAAGWESCLP